MATAEEIRARIARRDQQRIAKRAEAATKVHGLVQRRDATRRQLARLDRQLGTAVQQATAVMTLEELGEFLARSHREVTEWAALAPPRNPGTGDPAMAAAVRRDAGAAAVRAGDRPVEPPAPGRTAAS